MTRILARVGMLFLLGAAAMLYAVASVSATPPTVTLLPLPTSVYIGQKMAVRALVGSYVGPCKLTISYHGGRTDHGTHRATAGDVRWTVRIPQVPPGPAKARVTCGKGRSSPSVTLVQLALLPPKVIVDKTGFTQVAHTFDDRSDVSYGLQFRNGQPLFDAVNVDVLTNFITADNRVLGSAHIFLQRLPAGSTFFAGGEAVVAERTQVVRLETVVHATSAEKEAYGALPVSDVVVNSQLNTKTPPYVDSLHGQVYNSYNLTVQSAQVGAVLLDAAGNIIGGGFGFIQGPIKHDAREGFSISGTFTTVPYSLVASAQASAVVAYATR